MPTPITVELQWLSITEGAPTTNFGHFAYAQAYGPQVGCGAALLAAALPSLPADITVTNARIELDYYLYTNWGSGQIKRLHRGMSKTESTWNLLNKTTGKTWLSGGPFLYGTDCTTLFWSGAFTDDDPQVCTGTAALAAYIEGKGESNWVLFAVIGAGSGDNKKDLDGARLKFDWTAAGTPVLTGFSPSGMVAGATPVLYAYGADLDAGALTAITLVGGSNYNLTSIALDSAAQIHGTVPGGVAVGSYSVRATIGGSNYTAPGSFVVSSATPTLSNCRGDDGGVDFVHHKRRTLTCTGTSLTGTSSITLLGQEGQGDTNLTSITNVSSTTVTGWLLGPIPPGRYQVRVVCSAGTVYREIDVTLGPAWW